LRHWSDKIDRIITDESQDGAGSENEHQRNHRRRDDDGTADVAPRGTGFAGEDGDVLESAKSADRELTEDVETIKN
jgi:hypothetical protein